MYMEGGDQYSRRKRREGKLQTVGEWAADRIESRTIRSGEKRLLPANIEKVEVGEDSRYPKGKGGSRIQEPRIYQTSP